MKHRLIKLSDKIYTLWFESQYELGMHFVRYQEFYESSSPKFKGQKFTLIDFMEYYTLEFNKHKRVNCFTYPRDWGGYNIPMSVIKVVQSNGIEDFNKYDAFMAKLLSEVSNPEECYLIGTMSNDIATMEHEIAHALYFTNPEYKQEMLELSNSLDKSDLGDIFLWLDELGYHKDVHYDEMQAFLSTGSNLILSDRQRGFEICKKFRTVFTKYSGSLLDAAQNHVESSETMMGVEEQN